VSHNAPLRCVLITHDPAFRAAVLEAAGGPTPFHLHLELDQSFDEFSSNQVKTVRQAAPALVILDIESDPRTGLALARHLAAASGDLVLLGTGPELSSAQLLEAMRAGVAEYLPKPVPSEIIREAVDRLRPRVPKPAGGGVADGKVYTFFSSKGGSGATTVVTNLAVETHRLTRKKTLIVDLDPELGEVSLLLGVQPEFNFVDLINNLHRIDAGLLSSYIERHQSGVHFLSAPYHPDRAAGVTGEQVRQVIQYLREQYDFVFLDTSKSFGPTTVAALEAADQVYIVSTVDLPSLRNIQRGLPLLLRVVPGGKSHLRLLVNRFDPEGGVSLKELERTLELPVFATLRNDYQAVIGSINTGKPVVLNGRSAFSQDLKNLAAQVTSVRGGDEGRPSGMFMKLGRLFGRSGQTEAE